MSQLILLVGSTKQLYVRCYTIYNPCYCDGRHGSSKQKYDLLVVSYKAKVLGSISQAFFICSLREKAFVNWILLFRMTIIYKSNGIIKYLTWFHRNITNLNFYRKWKILESLMIIKKTNIEKYDSFFEYLKWNWTKIEYIKRNWNEILLNILLSCVKYYFILTLLLM